VCVVGYGTELGNVKNPAAVRRFWETYFRLTGARVAWFGADFPESGPCAPDV
jgi:hypothetical protein